ncbi:MAG: hypothetical protein ACI4T8_04250 [Christensenellales bacterium]
MSRSFSVSEIKTFIKTNRTLFLVTIIFLCLGISIGVIIMLGDDASLNVLAKEGVELADIISGEYSSISLMFSCLFNCLLSCLIMLVLGLNKYTIYLNYVYITYQGLLLGASCTSIISLNGITGALNVFIFTLPVNILNMLVICLMQVVLLLRIAYSKKFKVRGVKSFSIYAKKFLLVLVLAVLSSVIYGFIYPILLRSIVVVNY